MLYLTLLRNQWRQVIRSHAARYRWLSMLVLILIGCYVAGLLVAVGVFFQEMLEMTLPGRRAVAFLNEHLLSVLLGLFMLRFFLQRTPRFKIQPYLHLPVSRTRLVGYFQLASLASIHNLFPLLFFIPFWHRYVRGDSYPAEGALLWLIGVVAFLIAANYANTLVRVLLAGGTRQAALIMGLLLAVLTLDHVAGTLVVNRASAALFEALLSGQVLPLLLLVGGTGLVVACSGTLLRHRLLDDRDNARTQQPAWRVVFAPGQGQVMNLILLELTLIWRNKRPKMYFFLSLFYGTVYTAFFMADAGASSSSLLCAFIGVFASGMFAMNYGQLMFAWESSSFDGFLVRDVNLRSMVLAKLLLLQGSCLAFFFLTLPLFYWLAPGLVELHIAFLFYNGGVTCILMIALAVANRKRVDLQKGGGVFNYEGFSAVHWLWFIPTILPPTLVLFLLQDDRPTALVLIGGLGLMSLLLIKPWSLLFAHLLRRNRYVMAAGFRKYD